MKKIIAGLCVVLALGAFLWWSMTRSSSPPSATNDLPSGTSAGSETTNPAAGGTTGTAGGTTSGGSTATTGAYKDGTYTGTVADAFYGPLQVTATISGGKITDIAYPQFPNDQRETQEVNSHALPILKTEAIASQSAQVDIVSGATQSSQAFEQSLASALAQAQS